MAVGLAADNIIQHVGILVGGSSSVLRTAARFGIEVLPLPESLDSSSGMANDLINIPTARPIPRTVLWEASEWSDIERFLAALEQLRCQGEGVNELNGLD